MKTKKPKTEYEFGNQENIPFKDFNFESNLPCLVVPLEKSSKTNLDSTSLSTHFFTYDQSAEDIPTILNSKDTQSQIEAKPVPKSDDISKLEIVTMSQLGPLPDPASVHQVASISPTTSESETIPLKSNIRKASTQNTIDIHLDTDSDSNTDIEATTPSTIHEFPSNSNVRNPARSPKAFTNTQPPMTAQPQIPLPPHKPTSPPTSKHSPSSSFGTAIIIPPSIPYKTHLPSRIKTTHQTPSRTPQSPLVSSPSSYAADLQIWERITVMEKPLPHLPWEPVKIDLHAIRVDNFDGEEESVGCLGSRRLGRLRARILGKMRTKK